MIKQFLTISAFAIAISSFQPALAHDHKGFEGKDKPKLTKEEHEERKAKWEAMSDAEKIKVIEEKRAEKRQKMDEKWSSMSDAEKIAFVEERRKKKGDKRKERRGKKDAE